MPFETRNPTSGELIATYPSLSAAEVDVRLDRAMAAFRLWRRVSFDERARLMRRAAEILEHDAAELGRIMTLEMGKPIGAAGDEARKCARACRYYAEHAAQFLATESIATEAADTYVRYEPLGVVLAVMPWNFPFWQVFRFAAPALMAGNVGLLKHAPNVPQCAQAIDDVFRRAGFAHGVFQSLFVEVDQVPAMLADARVAAATLTGSERAGAEVAAHAGRAIKKVVLELGGSDPFIVMPSADLACAVATAVTSRTINNGQSCIAAKRFIVHESVADAFLERFVPAMAALRVGDPADPATQIGPLARADLRDGLDAQVRASLAKGARVLTGGAPLDGPGYFYPPTVLTDVPPDSPAYREELFGPVASVFRAGSVDHAIAIANDTRFGLAASVWTRDAAERDRFVADLDVGQVFVNAMVASDPRVPFGGVRKSGHGRELGPHGIREFVSAKTVWAEGG